MPYEDLPVYAPDVACFVCNVRFVRAPGVLMLRNLTSAVIVNGVGLENFIGFLFAFEVAGGYS